MVSKLLIYCVGFAVIAYFRYTSKGFQPENLLADLLFIFIISIPLILVLWFLEKAKSDKQSVAKLQVEMVQNRAKLLQELPEKLVYKSSRISAFIVSILTFIGLFILTFVFSLVAAAYSLDKNRSDYEALQYYSVAQWSMLGIFVIWALILTFKQSVLTVDRDYFKFSRLDLFLQTKKKEFKTLDIESIQKFYFRSGKTFTRSLGFYNKIGNYSDFSRFVDISYYGIEKTMSELELFNEKYNLGINVINNSYQDKVPPNFDKNLFRNIGQIIILVLAYFFIPLLIYIIVSTFF